MSDFHCCETGCCPENQQLKQDLWELKENLESELSALKERDAILLDKIEIIKEEYLIEKDHLSAARKCVEALKLLATFPHTISDENCMCNVQDVLEAYDRAMGGKDACRDINCGKNHIVEDDQLYSGQCKHQIPIGQPCTGCGR